MCVFLLTNRDQRHLSDSSTIYRRLVDTLTHTASGAPSPSIAFGCLPLHHCVFLSCAILFAFLSDLPQ